MALYLSAEQKNLKSLFANDNRYVIPSYQRHYSWTLEQCRQLYDDVMEAYSSETDSYFLGNIVLAEDKRDDRPEVVDGQQRLITLWLFLKAIHVLQPSNNRLKRMIQVEAYEDEIEQSDKASHANDNGAENDEDVGFVSSVFSQVFEVKDQSQIATVLRKTKSDYENDYDQYIANGESKYYKSSPQQVLNNAVAIYALIREYFSRIDIEKQRKFIDYFISKIYLLPIVLKDDNLDDARSNALMVFETINNRGMDLEDADIFKARLYNMALNAGRGEDFIEQWKALTKRCEDLDIKIDDLFRYYYHIIRGKEGIVVAEKRLREFFQKDPKSPFKTGGYEIVLDALKQTLDVIQLYYDKQGEVTRLAAWLQILKAYTNQNPVYAFIVYLYFNKNATDEELIVFLKKVLRYCYYRGSTMSVKFEIYNIIYKVAHRLPIDDYMAKNIESWMWKYPGRLRAGFSLLYLYMKDPEQKAVQNFKVDKIVKPIDEKMVDEEWRTGTLEEDLSSLGNYIVLDMPLRSKPLHQRFTSYSTSKLSEVRNLLGASTSFTKDMFDERQKRIISVLEDFFVNGIGK